MGVPGFCPPVPPEKSALDTEHPLVFQWVFPTLFFTKV